MLTRFVTHFNLDGVVPLLLNPDTRSERFPILLQTTSLESAGQEGFTSGVYLSRL